MPSSSRFPRTGRGWMPLRALMQLAALVVLVHPTLLSSQPNDERERVHGIGIHNPINPGLIPMEPGRPPIDPAEPETIPRAPTQLDLGLKTSRSVELWWLDQSDVEDGYRIERRPAGDNEWTHVKSTGPVGNSPGHYVDGPALALGAAPRTGRSYCYRVVPFNQLGSPPAVPELCTRLNLDLKRADYDEVGGVIRTRNEGRSSPYAIPDLSGFETAVLVFDRAGLLTELGVGPPDRRLTWTGRKLVYVADEAVIDLSFHETIRLPGNLTLMSGRRGIVEGALIHTRNLAVGSMFRIAGNRVEVKGLRFRGPSGGTSRDIPVSNALDFRVGADSSLAGVLADEPIELRISGNEFARWPGSGVYLQVEPRGLFLREGATERSLESLVPERIRVDRNHFLQNQRQNRGYGVRVGAHGYALIEKNTFDYNRHAIAHTGGRGFEVAGYGPETGYRARLNLVLPGHARQCRGWGCVISWQTHHFDVHGTKNGGIGSWFSDTLYNDGWAGEFIEVTGNAFLTTKGLPFKVRGTPSGKAVFRDNVVVARSTTIGAWAPVEDHSDRDNVEVGDNIFVSTPCPREQVAVGDFDGDGRDDVFLATGTSWYLSYGAKTEWRFLNESGIRLRDLVLIDHDGDGRTDALRQVDGSWFISSGASSPWRPVDTGISGLSDAAPGVGSSVIGDFDGDGSLETLEFDRVNDRYFHVDGERYSRYPM